MSTTSTIETLAREARGGDADAALDLARRAPSQGFLSWLARWVPKGEMTVEVFDLMSDAYHRMEMERECMDTEPEEKNA